METSMAIRTVLEILAVLFVVYGVLHEEKFIAFEEKLARKLKRKLRMYLRRKAIEKKRAQGKHLHIVQNDRSAVAKRQSIA